jgi:hypothetical protein
VVLVREQTVPTERKLLVGEVSANFFADRGCCVVSATDLHGCMGKITSSEHIIEVHFFAYTNMFVKCFYEMK